MANIRREIDDGENDKVRQRAEPLRERIRASDGPRQAALGVVLFLVENIPFKVDDPIEPDEGLILRGWRTVEQGYRVMDERHAKDPSIRIYPREEWRFGLDGERTVAYHRIASGPDPGLQKAMSPDAGAPGSEADKG